jgi:hypothetical protein
MKIEEGPETRVLIRPEMKIREALGDMAEG